MAYIPKDAEWFLAELVEEFVVHGYKRNAVHINYVLIQARTPDEAYSKAIKLGRQHQGTWKNPAGQTVTHRFVGLRDLDVIYDPLEHGCEIMFIERLGLSRAGLRKLVRKKKQLEAFRPVPIRRRRGRPDYSSKEILDMVGIKHQKAVAAPRDGAPHELINSLTH
jgi:hypothetical protein